MNGYYELVIKQLKAHGYVFLRQSATPPAPTPVLLA